MSDYHYVAANRLGQTVRGRISADSEGTASVLLDRQGLIPLNVAPVFSWAHPWRRRRAPRWTIEEKILFTQKLASLLQAGIPILTVLKLIAAQTRHPHIAAAIRQVEKDVSGGMTLSDALAVHPTLFDSIYLGAIRAGEATGRLDDILSQTSVYLERQMDTRRQVSQTLRYPIMVVTAMAIAAAIILKFVVPQFLAFYSNFNASLPMPTRILIAIATWFNRLWWIILIGVVSGGFAYWRWIHTERGRAWKDAMLLRLPLVGSLFLKVSVSRFCRLFGVLFSAGVPVSEALDTVGPGIGNVVVANEVRGLRRRIIQGESVADPPAGSVMPDLVYQMLGIGFESGDVDRMLAEAARHFEHEVDYDVRRLNDRLQPLLLALLASGVLLLALSVLLPMWNLISVFRQ
jgi:type II secretory pathway component PulF